MNRMQKTAWLMVICIGAGLVLSCIATTILYFKGGFPRAFAGFAFMGLGGFGGLGPIIFRKDPGAATCDERDRAINSTAAKAGFGASYLVFGGLAMGIWSYYGAGNMINVNILPNIWAAAFITAFFVHALTILILYSRGK